MYIFVNNSLFLCSQLENVKVLFFAIKFMCNGRKHIIEKMLQHIIEKIFALEWLES